LKRKKRTGDRKGQHPTLRWQGVWTAQDLYKKEDKGVGEGGVQEEMGGSQKKGCAYKWQSLS